MNSDDAGPLSTTGGRSVWREEMPYAPPPEQPDGNIGWEHCEESHRRSPITLMRADGRRSNRARR